MNRIVRRTLAGVCMALTAVAARAAVFAPEPDDMAIGAAKAPVVVVEYASAGCPHCAKWANEVFPAFKARFVDTGKVRFVLREMNFGDPGTAAAGFMLARCEGPARYFAVVDEVFEYQAGMYVAGSSPGAVLSNIAKIDGVSDATYRACLTDDAARKAFNARAERHRVRDHVDETPTFEVNGRRLSGEGSLDALGRAIAQARPGRG